MSDEDLELANTLEDSSGPPASGAETAREYLERGDKLGRYMIVELLGSGGMGIVYSAFDPQLDRKVACKVLRKQWDAGARLRLQREAKAMAKLSHPNVVSVYEVASDQGHVYVVMELVDGQDIESWGRGDHTPDEILEVYAQAGEGLAAAHKAGLVHRDFKPQNVLIDREGRVLVTDFGLARQDSVVENEKAPAGDALSDSTQLDDLTRTGLVLGTPAYMAPEQHLARAVDARSDQFCFCVSLYEALCGKRPYSGDTYAVLREQVISEVAQPLPESVAVPVSVRKALARGLSRTPDDRFASMRDLLAALDEHKGKGRLGLVTAAVAAVLLVALTGLVVAYWTGSSAEEGACVADSNMLVGSWDQRIRKSLEADFLASGAQDADATFAAFERLLDDYGDELISMRKEICESNRGPDATGDENMVLQIACLQKRRQALAGVTRAYMSVEAQNIERSVEAAMRLESVAGCRDIEALERGVPAPPAALADEVESLRGRLKEAEALSTAGQVKAAVALARTVRDESADIAFKPLRAEAHFALGLLLLRAVKLAEAQKVLEEAVLAAEESEHYFVRAKALVSLTEIFSGGSSDFEQARRYSRQARAAIDNWGGSADLDLQLSVSRARLKERNSRPDEALVELTSALRGEEARKDGSALNVAKLQNRMVRLYIVLGNFEAANAQAKESHSAVQALLGDSHTRTIRYLGRLAQTYRLVGAPEKARELDLGLREFWASKRGQTILREHKDYRSASRNASGTVVDRENQPVSGAEVTCGHRIFGDSKYSDAIWDARLEALYKLRTVRSADDGSFLCEGVSTRSLVLIADKADVGPSKAFYGEASAVDVEGVVLRVGKPGSLTGLVLQEHSHVRLRYVTAIPLDTTVSDPQRSLSAVVHEGRYRFERLAPGDYRVVAAAESGQGENSHQSEEVRIEEGRVATVNFEESMGVAGLSITIRGEYGSPVASVQLMIIPGHHEVTTGKEFGEKVYARGIQFRQQFVTDGEHVEILDLDPGLHTLCLLPLGGDHRNPEFMGGLNREKINGFSMYCHDIDLKAGETYEDHTKVPLGDSR